MKKKLTVGTTVAIALIVGILTFQITYVTTLGIKNDSYSTGNGASQSEDSFISEVLNRLTELDTKFRGLYIDEDKLDEELLADYIMRGYIAGTGDIYGSYYSAEEYEEHMSSLQGESVGIGVSVIFNADEATIEIINVMPDSPALEAGLAPGDLIVLVGEEKLAVADIGYDAALAVMKGEEGSTAYLSVKKHGEAKLTELEIKRAKVESVSVLGRVCTVDSTVGIIKITGFDGNTPDQFKAAVESLETEGCTSFVIDLRYNPGGELGSVVNTLDYLLPEGPVIRIFDADDKLVEQYDSDSESKELKMALLVNGYTASAAELFTSALMDYDKATVIGETTVGKGCMQTIIPLSDGSAVKVTYRMYRPPFSEGYHGVGIKPDIEVALDEALIDKNIYKITDEEDNQLRAALEALKAE